MADDWRGGVSNEIKLVTDAPFAAILGESPSKGARSPKLWNAAFSALKRPEIMHPFDVAPEQLTALLEGLEKDAHFIGGAVAVPHKETIAAWLGPDRLTPEAAKIGATNCLFRGEDGRLRGSNTDGEAALRSLEGVIGTVKDKKIALIGPGGAGKAVAAFLRGAGAELTLFARTPGSAAAFAASIGAKIEPLNQLAAALSDAAALVNCSSVGHAGRDPRQSPVAPDTLAELPVGACVYDIIYDPRPTALLQAADARGLKTLDGLEMNALQAVMGFSYAAQVTDVDAIRDVMADAG